MAEQDERSPLLPKSSQEDSDDKTTDSSKSAPTPAQMVGSLQLFRFAKVGDWLMIFGGVLVSCMHGATMPLMIIVFGDMTDTFVNQGSFTNFLNTWWGNISTTAAELHINITKEEALKNPLILEPIFEAMNMSGELNRTLSQMGGDFLDQMTSSTIYYVGLGGIVLVLGYLQGVLWLSSSYRQTHTIRARLLAAILKQEIGWFDTHESGELNTRLSDDVMKIQEGVGDKLGLFFQWTATFISGFVVGFLYGWKLTLVILAVSPLLAVAGAVMSKLGASFSEKELKSYAKAGAVAEEVLSSIRTVVAFGGQQRECERYNYNLSEARSSGVQKGLVNGAAMGFVNLVMFASYALAFWYGTKLIMEDPAYTAGNMLIVFFCVLIGAFAVGSAAPNIQYFATARGAAYAIYSIIDQEPFIDSSSEEGLILPKVIGNIEFKNVKFNYPSRPDVEVVSGLNLRVTMGQTVALVGSSGCGKSTTVQLIQRFYDPLMGQVLVDGVDIRQLNVKWWRQQIGVVSQEPVLFATTIAENIRYGREGITQSDIEHAAKMANAHAFIMKLPNDYETLVGERGAQLSGGQKQRIAIARALVRDPKILLLDEATSALDTESEAMVQAALDKARMGRTTIVIAHRLSTIKTADVIAGFRDGIIMEQGGHDELMDKQGIYYQLVTTQSQDPGEEHLLGDEGNEQESPDVEVEFSRTVSSPGGAPLKRLLSGPQGGTQTDPKQSKEEEELLADAPVRRIMWMNAAEWPFILLGCLAAGVSGAIQPAFAILFSDILGIFSYQDEARMKSESEFYSLLFLALGGAAGLAYFAMTFFFALSGENLTMRLRRLTFKTLLRQEIAYFDDHRNTTGALTTRLSTDASAVQGATGSRLATFIQSFGAIGAGVVIGFIYSWKLTLVILGFAPFLMLASYFEMMVFMGTQKEDRIAYEEAGKVATEAIENIRTVATLTKEHQFHKNYIIQITIPYKRNMRKVHLRSMGFALSQAMMFFAYAACFRFGAYLMQEDGLEYTAMFKVFSAIVFSAMSVGEASGFAPDYGKAKIAAARLFALFDREVPIDSYEETGLKPKEVQGEVKFEDVKFNYPSRPNIPVLRGLNLGVHQGERLALVGSSGCGKSTTVQLLERFYDPLEGSMLLDGEDIRDLNLQWLRQQIGLVQQEPILFDRSIRDNIAYGDNTREVPMDEIIAAARKANIHDFIQSLPVGYETNVGDKGTQLSGGQKQRVAIARALVRNPKVLLLDEATSALDTESERIVQEALDKAQEGRTCIVIAHRLSTIQNADCIAVIHNGNVCEMGTHSELLNQRGIYYKLNNAQLRQK